MKCVMEANGDVSKKNQLKIRIGIHIHEILTFNFRDCEQSKRFSITRTLKWCCNIHSMFEGGGEAHSGRILFCSTKLRPLLNCFCKILCMSTRWIRFLISTVHELSSREKIFAEPKKYWQSQDSKLGQLGEKRKRYLCVMQPPSHLAWKLFLSLAIKLKYKYSLPHWNWHPFWSFHRHGHFFPT